jgi:hypothetical protein
MKKPILCDECQLRISQKDMILVDEKQAKKWDAVYEYLKEANRLKKRSRK